MIVRKYAQILFGGIIAMKRKSSKALIITTVIVAMLVLICVMVGCTPKPPKPPVYKASEALAEVIDAADKTLGKVKNNTGDVSLGLSIGVKGENLKLNINEGDVKLPIGVDSPINFDAKVKIGANLSANNATDNEIKAEILLDNAVKLGLYSKDDVVYIQDGITTTATQKLKVSGAKAVGYNQYLDDLPKILKDALGGLDFASLKQTVTSFGDIINNLITAKKNNDSVSLDVVFLSDDPTKGLGPVLEVLGDQLKFGQPFDGLLDTYLPYILGGSFADFSVSGKVKATSKISINVGMKNNELTGLSIVIDLDPLKNAGKDVGGKITIEIGDLVIATSKTDVLPADLNTYSEGAVTANLALNIPGNDKLQLSAKIEFSPSLVDKDLKVKVVASAKDSSGTVKEVDLKGGYINLGTDAAPDYAVVFDIGYLYDLAGLERPADTTYKYSVKAGPNGSMGLGEFLESLIKSQRVFVFFDELDGGFWNNAPGVDFFKLNGETFTAADLADITTQVKNHYAKPENFGGSADDYVVEYRNADGTLAMSADGTKGDFVGRKAELGYNLELTAIVTLKDRATYTGTYDRDYADITFRAGVGANSAAEKTVVVRLNDELDISHLAPEYTVAKGYDFGYWEYDGSKVYLDQITLTKAGNVTFKADDISAKQKVVFKKFDLTTDAYVDYVTRYYDKEGTDIMIEKGSVPEVPVIFGMDGQWVIINAQEGSGSSRSCSTEFVTNPEDDTRTYSAYIDAGVVSIYPVYAAKSEMNWKEYGEGAWELENRFVRKILNEGKVTSIFEVGDPSLIGQGAVNAILGRLGDIFKIIGNKSVDANFVSEIIGSISPYLASEDLIIERLLDIMVDYSETKRPAIVDYPYEMPSLANGDNTTVSATDVAALEDGKGILKEQKNASDLVTGFANRCNNAAIWATYQRYVGLYGYLEEDEYKDLCWTSGQISDYTDAKDGVEKAKVYLTNETKSYNEKVKAAQKKFADAVKDQGINEMILDYVKLVLGDSAVGSNIKTVKDFVFGNGGTIAPLKVALDFAEPAANSGYGVTIKLMRGDTLLASIGGDVFLSKASDIVDLDKADFANAKDVTDGSILEELLDIADALLEGKISGDNSGSDSGSGTDSGSGSDQGAAA